MIVTFDPIFADLARIEVDAIASDVDLTPLGDGVLLLTGVEFVALAEGWRSDPPIFVRHVCPAMVDVALCGGKEDPVRLLAAMTSLLELVEPECSFSVQTRILCNTAYRPFHVNKALSDAIALRTGAALNVRAPEQIVSLVVARPRPDSRGDVVGYLGISLSAHNLSDWAGGMRRFAREPDQISRAEFKLLEALEVFGVDLVPRGIALDLGASPGGWTRVLRQHGQYVTAVDPGLLDQRLAGDSHIRHIAVTAEAYLRDAPDRFDVIVNDMRMDARDSARLMVAYAPHLYDHGIAIMTLKLPESGRTALLQQAFAILGERYAISGARHLFHNRSEITLLLRKV